MRGKHCAVDSDRENAVCELAVRGVADCLPSAEAARLAAGVWGWMAAAVPICTRRRIQRKESRPNLAAAAIVAVMH